MVTTAAVYDSKIERLNRLVVLLLVLGGVSCARNSAVPEPAAELRNEVSATPVAPARTAATEKPRVVVLGDSLTAGLGLDPNDAYPAVLQRMLHDHGYVFDVVNAGVSGDTSADGLRRVNWALDGNVQVLVLALGANDGLRGLPPAQMKENLQRIITQARQRGIAVLLAGMEAPPNFGERYTNEFRAVYRDLANTNQLPFVPFLLEGVAAVPGLNQADGVHPTARGAAMVAATIWPTLEKMIQTGRAR
jgi:acyl-CoA thioesterase-1